MISWDIPNALSPKTMNGWKPTVSDKPGASLFPLCLTSAESRGAVNKTTAHCSANSAYRICFIWSILLPQSWNKEFFTVSMPKIPHRNKEEYGIGMSSLENPKDLPCRWAVLVGNTWTTGLVLETKPSKSNWRNSSNLLNLLGAFCVWSYIHLPRVLLAYSPTFK